MKPVRYKNFIVINALAGYLESVVLGWQYYETSGRSMGLEILGLFVLAVCGGLINLLLWCGYGFETWYAKKHPLTGWGVPGYIVVPGMVLNLILVGVVGLSVWVWLGISRASF